MVNIKNRELERLSLEHRYNLNNIDIIVRQSAINYEYSDVNRISIGIKNNDKIIEYRQLINNNIFKELSKDGGKYITDIISHIVQKIFCERGLI